MKMSEQNKEKVLAKKKSMTEESKKQMVLAGGSLKTKYPIDAQAICRDVRYGYAEDTEEEPVEVYKLAWNKLYNEIASMIDKDVESESNDVLLGIMLIMDKYSQEMQ